MDPPVDKPLESTEMEVDRPLENAEVNIDKTVGNAEVAVGKPLEDTGVKVDKPPVKPAPRSNPLEYTEINAKDVRVFTKLPDAATWTAIARDDKTSMLIYHTQLFLRIR